MFCLPKRCTGSLPRPTNLPRTPRTQQVDYWFVQDQQAATRVTFAATLPRLDERSRRYAPVYGLTNIQSKPTAHSITRPPVQPSS